MVNYHTKKAKRAQQAQAVSQPKPAESQTTDVALRTEHVTVHPPTLYSLKAKQATRPVAYFPPPTPGLINDKDRSTYNAIWWHRYAAPAPTDELNWQEKCRADASQIIWHVAKMDKTIFELFMCFSAAKEILVKGSTDTRAYYRYKGRAITSLSQDVNRELRNPVSCFAHANYTPGEGVSLNVNAISAICLLNRIAFAEHEYDAADLHVRALQKLTAQRIRQLPGFCWLIVVWADLHLTGVQVRPPYLAYYVHPEFRSRPFSGMFQSDADNYFSKTLPGGIVMSSHFKSTAIRLYEALRELVYSFGQRDLEWTTSRGLHYEVAYLIAEFQADTDRSGTLEQGIIIVGCEMQFWGVSKPFVPQSGIQSFQMDRLSQLIAKIPPNALCTRWLKSTSNLDLLLWSLMNAAGSSLHQLQPSTSSESSQLLPTWLQNHVAYITELLDIVSPEDLEARMQRMPFSKEWNRPACRAFFSGPRTHGYVAADAKHLCEPNVELFRDLRLLFDSDRGT
jgi:hypothetical protein